MANFVKNFLSAAQREEPRPIQQLKYLIPCIKTLSTIKNEKFRSFQVELKHETKVFFVTQNYFTVYDGNEIIIYRYEMNSKIIFRCHRKVKNHLILVLLELLDLKVQTLLLNIISCLCEKNTTRLLQRFQEIIENLKCRDIVDYEIKDGLLYIYDKYGQTRTYPATLEPVSAVQESKTDLRLKNSTFIIQFNNRSFSLRLHFDKIPQQSAILNDKVFLVGEKLITILDFAEND